MGSDWYNFVSTTAAAIPVPKDALQQPFDMQGFKLMTSMHEHYDENLDLSYEYHGALICLEDTELTFTSLEVIGPYEITETPSECKRMKHLDALMPADTREKLTGAFEKYTGHKPDVVPGFWTVSAVSKWSVQLHTTWCLGDKGSIVAGQGFGGSCEEYSFTVDQDA
ncbi:hypothetical protein BGZ75_004014 [Mortierella antarctica]|nr:hypothetical protein BGZ75_004014 [Mortierella antarctica]